MSKVLKSRHGNASSPCKPTTCTKPRSLSETLSETVLEGGHLCYDKLVKTHRWKYLADPLIRRGYRVTSRPQGIFYSLFELHNETINVWVHLIGGILFIWLFVAWTYTLGPIPLQQFPPLYRSQGGTVMQQPLAVCDNPAVTGSVFWGDNFAHTCPTGPIRPVPGSTILSKLLLEKMSALSSVSPAIEKLQRATEQHASASSALGNLHAQFQLPFAEAATKAVDTLNGAKEWLNDYSTELNIGLGWTGCGDCVANLWKHKSEEFANAAKSLRETAKLYSNRLTDIAKDAEHASELTTLARLMELSIQAFEGTLPKVELIPQWPLLIYMICASVCLLSSAVYHLGLGYDKITFNTLCRVDLAGISFMICGSFFPPIYYTFYCNDDAVFYYIAIESLLCFATLVFCALPERLLHNDKVRIARVLSYVCAGLFAIVPVVHIAWEWGLTSEEMHVYLADGNLILIGALYLLGAVLYTSRFPESFSPGKFDYFLSSHQLWHACVLAAALIHYYGSVNQYHWRRLNPICPAVDV